MQITTLRQAIVLTAFLPFLFAFTAPVQRIIDGDTIVVMHDDKLEKIRLYGIDCPEKGQPFSQEATDFTSRAALGKTVDIETVSIDNWGRTVGIVSVSGTVLNESLLSSGFARVYKKYCKRRPMCTEWEKIEIRSREAP